MIRTMMMTLLTGGLLALGGLSAVAATPAARHHGKAAAVVAQADGVTPAPDAAKPQKKIAKKAKVTKADKDKATTTDGPTAGTPSPEKMPEKK